MDNQNRQKCGKMEYLESKPHIEYDQRQQGESSSPSQGRISPTPPVVSQGARRVKDETEENINSDANNSNNGSVTSYCDSISSDVFLSSLSSSLLTSHQHEIALASKSCLIDEVNTSYKHQFILDSTETKRMSGILKLFTAIKYFHKNYKGIFILGYGLTKLKVHGIGTIAVEIQKNWLSYTMSYISRTFPTPFSPSLRTVINLIARLWSRMEPLQ